MTPLYNKFCSTDIFLPLHNSLPTLHLSCVLPLSLYLFCLCLLLRQLLAVSSCVSVWSLAVCCMWSWPFWSSSWPRSPASVTCPLLMCLGWSCATWWRRRRLRSECLWSFRSVFLRSRGEDWGWDELRHLSDPMCVKYDCTERLCVSVGGGIVSSLWLRGGEEGIAGCVWEGQCSGYLKRRALSWRQRHYRSVSHKQHTIWFMYTHLLWKLLSAME